METPNPGQYIFRAGNDHPAKDEGFEERHFSAHPGETLFPASFNQYTALREAFLHLPYANNRNWMELPGALEDPTPSPSR